MILIKKKCITNFCSNTLHATRHVLPEKGYFVYMHVSIRKAYLMKWFDFDSPFRLPHPHRLNLHAHSPPTTTYITPRNLVCSWKLDKHAALRLPPTQAHDRMELTKILMEMQPASLPPFHQLLALVCLVAIIYKVTTILVKRNKILQHFKAFPGPPGHWFFGHSLRVFWRFYGQ